MPDPTLATDGGYRIGVALWQELAPQRLAELGRQAENAGFDHLWYANHKLYRDLFVGLGILAANTSAIGLGTFVAEPYSQHPAQIATAAATIHELANGRTLLGLGAGGGTLLNIGLRRERPIGVMTEAIEISRRLLAGERFDYAGKHFSLRDAQLELPVRGRLPVLLAARGDQMLRAGGRAADSVIVAPFATTDGLAHARAQVERGLTQAGRPLAGFPLVARVDVAIDDDLDAAADAVRPVIAMMVMASYPNTGFLERAGLRITPELAEMSSHKDERLSLRSGHLVPDEYVSKFAWVGPPDVVAAGIAGAIAAGYRNIAILLQPLHRDPGEAMDRFAREVMPLVKRLVT